MKHTNDVNKAGMSMGNWKNTSTKRKHIHTGSGKTKTYTAFPPPEGWPGGDPAKNGWKASKGK